MEDAVNLIKGVINVLSGIWGVILFPFAIVILYNKTVKIVGFVLMFLVGIFVYILIHDIHAHVNNRRLWIPFYERCFRLTVPVGGSSVFSECQFARSNMTLKVSHEMRGKHAISVWIPEKMKDFSPVKAAIRFKGKFCNQDGKPIFDFCSDDKFTKLWTWCRGKRGGSHEIYYKYSVPDDVPVDEELILEISPIGNVDDFLQMYPAAKIAVEKYSDK